MAATIEAERVTDNPDTQSGQPGQRVIGYWLDLTEAAGVLGVSDRTVRRRIKAGELPNRMHKGRRQVRIDTADMTDATGGQRTDNPDAATEQIGGVVRGDKVAGSVADALATIDRVERDLAGVLALMGDELRAERQLAVERVEAELVRVRRRSGLGWVLALILAGVGAAGAVVGVQAMTEARIEAAALTSDLSASQGQVATLTTQLESASTRADQAVSALSDMTGQLSAAQVQTLEAELRGAQAEAQRDALLDRAPGVLKP
jgi:excisionase family DNA binding protein